MAEVKVGIIPRLLDLPVTEYIFEENGENSDWSDSQKMWFQIAKFFNSSLEWGMYPRCLPIGGSEELVWTSNDHVHLYVDGVPLSAVVEVVYYCMCNCIRLTLWHYDRASKKDFQQHIEFGFCPF